ncbi:MAG: Penicillin-binding protein [Planctomycetota bacterium]
MRNSLLPAAFSVAQSAPGPLAPGSAWRLAAPAALAMTALAGILWRTAVIQSGQSGAWLDALQATTVEEELLPARDGRIVADSQVLAADEELAAVQVHYRWLQTVPDPAWITLQLRQRLTREERRDPSRVAEVKQSIERERRQLFESLAEATHIPLAELIARRDQIDSRVQRIAQAVNSRATSQRSLSAANDADDLLATESPGLLFEWASAVRTALTTPPKREAVERIVVREEESWQTLLEAVPEELAAAISEAPELFPGVRIVRTTRRIYPHPDTAVHLTGARTALPGQAKNDELHSQRIGRFGVEKSYQSQLAGVAGLRRIVRDRRHRVIHTETVSEPRSGRDVLLTIDWKLQQTAEQLLAEALGDAEATLLRPKSESDGNAGSESAPARLDEVPLPPEPEHIPIGGAVVVMDAHSGRLAALASAPEFDLSLFSHGTTAEWEAVNSDARRPFVARFLAMSLPPGSTWKIVTSVAAMDAGAISPDEHYECRGFLRNPDEHRCLTFRLFGHGHGPVDLQAALAQSCNTYFFNAATRMGTAPQVLWAQRFGFGSRTGVDLPFESTGQVPGVAGNTNAELTERERRRLEREALGLSIGQSRLTVTPLQLARLVAAVANGGWLVTPHVASDDGWSQQVGQTPAEAMLQRHRIEGVTAEQLAAIHAGMHDAVNHPAGTAYRTVRLPHVRIAGKTGTAEAAPGKPDHAWFAGWFPAEAPEYVVVVVLEHGGSGGRAAGPIARELVRCLTDTPTISKR